MGCQEAAHLIPQYRPSFPRKRRRHSKVTFTLKFAPTSNYQAEVTTVTHSTYSWKSALDADNPDYYVLQ